ncbi:MAG: hypothetical protein ACQEQE_10520 [Bacillota bacterium]
MNLTKIAFIGIYKAHIVFYIAQLLSFLDLDVAVVDNTKLNQMKTVFPFEDFEKVSYLGIDCYNFYEKSLEKYDYLLFNYDWGIKREIDFDEKFIFTDFNKINIEKSKSFLKKNKRLKEFILVYLNATNKTLDKEYFDYIFSKFSNIKISSDINLDSDDLAMQYQVQYKDNFRLKKLSKPMKDFLFNVVDETTDISKTDIKRGIKKGGNFENRFLV